MWSALDSRYLAEVFPSLLLGKSLNNIESVVSGTICHLPPRAGFEILGLELRLVGETFFVRALSSISFGIPMNTSLQSFQAKLCVWVCAGNGSLKLAVNHVVILKTF